MAGLDGGSPAGAGAGLASRGHEPEHLSFSQYTSYLSCGKSYELERVTRAPKVPAWWFIGGSLVHELTEAYDRAVLAGQNVNIDDGYTTTRLDEMVQAEVDKTGVAPEKWMAAGRGESKQRYEHWKAEAPLMLQRYIDWRAETEWPWAELDGVPIIETKLDLTVAGHPFKGAPDRVVVLPDGSLCVVDIKSGASAPKEPLQLGIYATGLEQLGVERPKWGCYWLARKGTHTPPVPLGKYTQQHLDTLFGGALGSIRAGYFPPNVSDKCRTCSTAASCFAMDGALSADFDPLDPNYEGNAA